MTVLRASIYDQYMLQIIQLRDKGMGFRLIAKLLYEEGLRPPFSSFVEPEKMITSLAGAIGSRFAKLDLQRNKSTPLVVPKQYRSGDWTPEMEEEQIVKERTHRVFEGEPI